MALQRIKFADNNSGLNAYTFAINPVAVEVDDSPAFILQENLESAPSKYNLSYDDRPLGLVWKGWPANHPTASGLFAALRSYNDHIVWIQWGTISSMFGNIHTGTGWVGPYVVTATPQSPRGDGGLILDEFKVVLYRSQ